ncbi:PH domain-containing protein [Echinicola jeungdonensis]|uniref:PH domain-containing protein n=1 Tax=Echinicola jeungdonensis TaxID=709343 RepID=A0ABV5J978_9BACT
MGLLSGIIGNAGIVDREKLVEKYNKLLLVDERIEIGFKLVRDTFIFTNKRLILVDKQGMTGKKTEYLSIAYKAISRFSVETGGTFDLDAELKIWISSEKEPSISKKFSKAVDVYEVQKILTKNVMG